MRSKEKKQKDKKPYKLKRTGGVRAARAILWIMLVFLMVRGIVAIVKPDQTGRFMEQLVDWKSGTESRIAQNTELLAFAEEFVREWGTYTEEEEFKARLQAYVMPGILERQNLHDFASTSTVTYANAYRSEEYAPGQYDVFVETNSTSTRLAQAETEAADPKKKETEAAYQPVTTADSYTLKVPVQVTEEGTYIAEGIPLFVQDAPNRAQTYLENQTTLEAIEDATPYQETITNFLKAYYSEGQQVLDYYLAKDADKESLQGFEQGSLELAGVEEVRAYREEPGAVLCLVHYQVRNLQTQEAFSQECSIRIDDGGLERLYIRSMDTKTVNLNLKKTEE